MNGLDEFKKVLKEFKNLSLWGAASSALLPFIASFLSIIPPWPSQLSVITASVQLITLVVVFQRFRHQKSKLTNKIRVLAFTSFAVLLAYMALFAMFTIYLPQVQRSIVIGYECNAEATAVFAARCPFLNVDDLASAAFDEFSL